MQPEHPPTFNGAVDVHYRTTDSTNSLAKRWLQTSRPPEGTIIRTDHQTAGRGRRGRIWEESAGEGFLATLILYPDFLEPADHFLLHMAFIIAVYDLTARFAGTDDLHIKWPNDLIWKGRKLAGILPESAVQQGRYTWFIAGCGLNVHLKTPPPGRPDAVSLQEITGNAVPPAHLTPVLRQVFTGYYQGLRRGEYDKINHLYAQLLYGRDFPVNFIQNNGTLLKGTIQGANRDGSLIVRSTAGRNMQVDFEHWRMYPYNL